MIFDRRLLLEMLILVSVSIGAWMTMVQPQRAESRALETKIAEAEQNPVEQRRAAIVRMASQVTQVRDRVREIHEQSRFGRDASQMYGLIMGLGKKHEVLIRRLDPGVKPVRADAPVEVQAFHMSIEGRYDRIGEFLQGIEDIDGFIRPGALNITPIGDTDNALIAVTFRCEVLSFKLPEAAAAMVEKDDAEQQ